MNQQPLTVIEHVVKEYPTMYKVTIFNHPLMIPKPRPGHKPKRNSLDPSEKAIEESLRRTRTAIFDYALANKFSYFVTFTFNPKKVDRYSIEETSNIMKYWLNRQKKHSPDFGYVIVPEFHKDKAIHFHALIRGYAADLKRTNVIQNGKRVYNVTGFTSGFTNAQELDDDQAKAAAYLTKYITKEMITTFNKRRYWASKNLLKPQKHYESLEQLGIAHYIHDGNLAYQSDECHLSIYQFSIDPRLDVVYEIFKPKQPETAFKPLVRRLSQPPSLPGIFKQLKVLPP